MRELSVEEKAKAYDKVREKIDLRFGSNVAEEIFSQFEESKDERIRKEIIDFICWETDRGSITKEQREKSNSWLAWLEKQDNNINCVYDKELSELLHTVICRYVNDPDISYIERDNVSKKIFPYVELLEKQDEQKPAWSEEDEVINNELIKYFESLLDSLATEERHNENRRWLNWLKFLKDRVQLIKQEVSYGRK